MRHGLSALGCLIVCSVGPVLSIPAEPAKPLDGRWLVVIEERDGKRMPAEDVADRLTVFEIRGDRLTIASSGMPRDEFLLEVNREGSPRTVDLFVEQLERIGLDNGKQIREVTHGKYLARTGICSLEGARLRLCFSSGRAMERPADFATTRKKPGTLYILEKLGPKPERK